MRGTVYTVPCDIVRMRGTVQCHVTLYACVAQYSAMWHRTHAWHSTVPCDIICMRDTVYTVRQAHETVLKLSAMAPKPVSHSLGHNSHSTTEPLPLQITVSNVPNRTSGAASAPIDIRREHTFIECCTLTNYNSCSLQATNICCELYCKTISTIHCVQYRTLNITLSYRCIHSSCSV